VMLKMCDVFNSESHPAGFELQLDAGPLPGLNSIENSPQPAHQIQHQLLVIQSRLIHSHLIPLWSGYLRREHCRLAHHDVV